MKDIISIFGDRITSGEIEFEYIQRGLRSATDIYKKGGHVVATYKDRKYSLEYDNKRMIDSKADVGKSQDSTPWEKTYDYSRIRSLKETVSLPVFDKGFSRPTQSKSYKSYVETGVRTFVRACLSDDTRLGIPEKAFLNYSDLIEYIRSIPVARDIKITKSSISHLKNRKPLSIKTVPRTRENQEFASLLKVRFPDFDEGSFFA